ncbi:DUF3080 domain-containing protein [Pseudidiomarina sp. CB1]|uniref:DUF3080 domain-containing protein n=1 Tax=Pseudidiomarina sp. CB1 TaxID=2972484 RepID=UPI002161CE34|nr:DUF3080 domain-containing protein [Pseudidiomarina sp. CB1]
MGTIVRSLRGLCYVFVAFLLSACSEIPPALSALDDYQSRVANTLELEPIVYHPKSCPKLPDTRDLRVQVPRVSVSLLDSWRLDQCAAGQLIAQRNSALGKLEEGISRYFTDLQLTQAMQICVTALEQAGEAQLAKRLASALQEKQHTLAASKQLAIATDDALRHSLRFAPTTLAAPDDAAFANALASLDHVLAVLQEPAQQPTQVSRGQLEVALEQLHQSDYLPRLWRSLHALDAYIQQLSPLTEDLVRLAGCSSKGRPQRAEVLHTVFLKFFIANVQPELAGYTRQGYLVNERLEELAAVSEQAALKDYLQQLMQLTERLNERSKHHVEPWQRFFAACDFTPG